MIREDKWAFIILGVLVACFCVFGSTAKVFENAKDQQVTMFDQMAYNIRLDMAGPPVPSVCEKTISGKDNMGESVGKLEIIDYRIEPGVLTGAVGPAFNLPALKQGKKESDADYAAALKKRDKIEGAKLLSTIYERGCKDGRYVALLGGLLNPYTSYVEYSLNDVEDNASDYKKDLSDWDQKWSMLQYSIDDLKVQFDTVPKKTPVALFQQVGGKVKLVQGGTDGVTNIARLYDGKTLLTTLDLDYGITPVFDKLQPKVALATDSVVCKYGSDYLSGSAPCKDLRKQVIADRQKAEEAALSGVTDSSLTPDSTISTPSPTETPLAG